LREGGPLKARVAAIVGTRPEAIKLAPVVRELAASATLSPRIVATAQHRDLLDQVLRHFQLTPDVDLDLMQPGQTLSDLTARAITGLTATLEDEAPAMVVVQGDTTTAMTGALAAFYLDIPVAHVEAGLRSGDIRNPFPEEVNRRIISQLAALHLAPTQANRDRLISEGVPPADVVVTGNPGIDAVLKVAESGAGDAELRAAVPDLDDEGRRLVLVTLHRRESFGEPLEKICGALLRLGREIPGLTFLLPMHPNPAVRVTIRAMLGEEPGFHLTEPLSYAPFVAAMQRATLILSDSGGVQEEAPSLNTPVLVLRDATERPEVVDVGAARLVGRDPDAVHALATRLLTDEAARLEMTGKRNPYGDGDASVRIRRAIEDFLAR
jgi:UDP-N-acetylglucosamine 2-epimerase (non-hydrolysing)